MKTLTTLATAVAALGFAAPASAGHDEGWLVVQNTFDGAAEVWIDGRYEGAVRGDSSMSFPIRPGNRTVALQRPSGYQLLLTRVHVHPRSSVELHVVAPPALLAVTNPTADRVWVRLDDQVIPLAPRQSAQVPVESGNVDFLVEMRGRYGSHVVDRREVWVEPGAAATVAVRFEPAPNPQPAPTWGYPAPSYPSYAAPAPRPVSQHDRDDDDDDHDHDHDHASCAMPAAVAYRD